LALAWNSPTQEDFIERVHDFIHTIGISGKNKLVLRAFEKAAKLWGLPDIKRLQELRRKLDPSFVARAQERCRYSFKYGWHLLKLRSYIIAHSNEFPLAVELFKSTFPELFSLCYAFVSHNKERIKGLKSLLSNSRIEEIGQPNITLHYFVPNAPTRTIIVSPNLKISALCDEIRKELTIPDNKVVRVADSEGKVRAFSRTVSDSFTEREMVYVLVEDIKRKERDTESSDSSSSCSEEEETKRRKHDGDFVSADMESDEMMTSSLEISPDQNSSSENHDNNGKDENPQGDLEMNENESGEIKNGTNYRIWSSIFCRISKVVGKIWKRDRD